MLFISAQQFFSKASKIQRLTREEEKRAFLCAKEGDAEAFERIAESYLPVIAAKVKRVSGEKPSLELIYGCIGAMEKAISEFDFLQDRESFTHRLGSVLRREITKHIAK